MKTLRQDEDMGTWRRGGDVEESWRHDEDMETWKRRGDVEETWRRGEDVETWRRRGGDVETWRRRGDVEETWRHEAMDTWRHHMGNGKTEAEAIFLNPFTVCSSCQRKCVVSPFVDEETNGRYLFANGLAHLC